MSRKVTPLPKIVKETVDFLYESLIAHPDGVLFSITSVGGTTQRRVASILIKRGIIEKTYISTGKAGGARKYKWAAAMNPTKTLYGSIVAQIRDEQKSWPSHQNKKQNGSANEDDNVRTDSVQREPEPIEETVTKASLSSFSSQELWDELKRRGYSIEEGKNAIVKKEYLN